MSPRHARVDWLGPRLLIIDLGSETGTLVNGEQVTCEELHLGDTLTLGDLEFRVLDSARDSARERRRPQSRPEAQLSAIAEIAHELRNPLNYAINFAQASIELTNDLLEDLSADEAELGEARPRELRNKLTALADNSEKINEHSLRAEAFLRGILARARGSQTKRTTTDLNRLVSEAVQMAAQGRGVMPVSIDSTHDETIGTMDLAKDDLTRVIINVVNNAIQAMEEKRRAQGAAYSPQLEVTTKSLGAIVEIRIRDNGVGVAAADLDRVFEPFFTTKAGYGGTGLGLSLSRDIITAVHDGEMSFNSELGEFSEVVLSLPADAPSC